MFLGLKRLGKKMLEVRRFCVGFGLGPKSPLWIKLLT